jgi:hypothetical protein
MRRADMATVKELLDAYTKGHIELETVLADFERREWSDPPKDGSGSMFDEGDPPDENSFDVVNFNAGLTSKEYAQMVAAYRRSLHRKSAG